MVAPQIVRLVSSAKSASTEESRQFDKSFTQSKNRRGPRFDPCGTPAVKQAYLLYILVSRDRDMRLPSEGHYF